MSRGQGVTGEHLTARVAEPEPKPEPPFGYSRCRHFSLLRHYNSLNFSLTIWSYFRHFLNSYKNKNKKLCPLEPELESEPKPGGKIIWSRNRCRLKRGRLRNPACSMLYFGLASGRGSCLSPSEFVQYGPVIMSVIRWLSSLPPYLSCISSLLLPKFIITFKFPIWKFIITFKFPRWKKKFQFDFGVG